jgi:hypothetical protein
LDEGSVDGFVEEQDGFDFGSTNPLEQWILVLPSGLNLLHDFTRNLYPIGGGLVADPGPKLRNLVKRVIEAVGGNEDVSVEEVKHLVASSRAEQGDQRVYVTGLDAEDLSRFRVCEESFCERSLHEAQERAAEPMPFYNVVIRAALVLVSNSLASLRRSPFVPVIPV